MNWDYIDYTVVGGLSVISAYPFALVGLARLSTAFSERIKSKNHLVRIINEEAEKLGLDISNLETYWAEKISKDYEKTEPGLAIIKGRDVRTGEMVDRELIDGKNIREIKEIQMKEGFFGTRAVVKHELYHLKNHCSRKKETSKFRRALKYFFHDEPTAVAYSLFGGLRK